MNDRINNLLRNIPSVSDLLDNPEIEKMLSKHPRQLIVTCVRDALDELRDNIINDTTGQCGQMHVGIDYVLRGVREKLTSRTQLQLRSAINASGIIMHTALGRSVQPPSVIDSMIHDMKGYVTLAIDRETGLRSTRHKRVESILAELTGAQSATVVNNNAAATLLALAAMAGGKEVIVSRGQLIEIGGSFRLPEVMSQSGAKLVEVGATNRTHLRDYENAITENTAAIMRVHPSNYRIMGFTSQSQPEELANLAHSHNLTFIDDIGAGALVDLEMFGLPHEPTVQESIESGADVVLFSSDKLIGGPQGGVIVGNTDQLKVINSHPLARALRVDKTCLMMLERTLHLFRDPHRLAENHPLYQMIASPISLLQKRAEALVSQIDVKTQIISTSAFLGSGSLPMEAIDSLGVVLDVPNIKPDVLAKALRLDESAVFSRIENGSIVLDMRTITDDEVSLIAEAIQRACV